MAIQPKDFSRNLKEKIYRIKEVMIPTTLGSLKLATPLIQAPMAGISSIPFRLLMEDLGAGATVSELISCHGINYGNERTLNMLKIHEREKITGLQLFGEDPKAMAKAAQTMEKYHPQFIDINMGCPVRKVVTKGGGSALLQNPKELSTFFNTIRNAIKIPLTIKIRTGWDKDSTNAQEVIEVAKECSIDWIAIHGRTRDQLYTGYADWEYLENLAKNNSIHIVGNGDLHTPTKVSQKLNNTNCQALMIARGSIRNPFIFLESYVEQNSKLQDVHFSGEDYFEIIERLLFYTEQTFDRERLKLIQLKKFIAWFAAGFPNSVKLRGNIFKTQNLNEMMHICESYFSSLDPLVKKQFSNENFMVSGHG